MTEKDERNYGTIEQLAPSYDEAAAAAQEMYALHGSNAQKQLEAIGPQREMAEAGAVENVQTGTAKEVTSAELGAATETLEQIMDLVSAELAIMEVSRKNSLDRQQQALDGYLQAMEAGLPYLEKTIQSRLDSIDAARGGGGGGGAGTGTGSGTTASGYEVLSDENKAVLNEAVGEPEYGDDPLNPANPMDTGDAGGTVTNAELLAQVWGVVPEQMFMFTGPDGQLLQHYEQFGYLMNTYIANGYSPEQAAEAAYQGVMAQGGENFTEDQIKSLDRFRTVMVGVNSQQNGLEGYEDEWTWQEREAAGLTEENGWYNSNQYTYNPHDAKEGQGFDIAGLPEGVGSGIVQRSPKEHYKPVPAGDAEDQDAVKWVVKDQESREYLKSLLDSEIRSWGDNLPTASELKAKGYSKEEIDILLEIQEERTTGKGQNKEKIKALEEKLVDIRGKQEAASGKYSDLVARTRGERDLGYATQPDTGSQVGVVDHPDYEKALAAGLVSSGLTPSSQDLSAPTAGGGLFDLLVGDTTTTDFAQGDEYLQALLDQRAADFARAQETDKEFEALHTAPTTQAPKNIDMMYNQMMERLAREEEERRKQAALEATIASQTAEQNIILPTPKPTPKPTTKPPAYDYSQANESWILF